ncbi:MAG TPA: hypothetical protein VLC97_02560, partial [Rhodanobacteraceae bacterium]|nr:hypothetical protein [Rhodanobacteraceae bacterium]
SVLRQVLESAANAALFFTARDGRYAGNTRAISGGCLDRTTSLKRSHFGWPDMPKMQEHFSAVPQWRGILKQNAENAGAFSGGCLDRTTSLNRNHFGWPDMPKMSEHFPAGACTARHPTPK